jgi:thiamine biosynthesis lipoprotein
MSTRRNILFGIGALAVGGAATLQARPVTRSRPGVAFGTTVNLTVTAGTASDAEAALDAGFAEIAAVHKAASLFDPDSEVSRLNRHGQLAGPSAILKTLFQETDRLFALTRGAFDPTIQPLWQVWANSSRLPSTDDIKEALRHVGWDRIGRTEDRLFLPPGASLTFNGLAQGLAADRVMAAMERRGATSAFIDTGESGLQGQDRRLAIRHPRGGILGTLRLRGGFVAVSGDYASSFTPDFLHHHIFDPQRGQSPRELASVVVVAPSGALADGLATAFMVMGQAKAEALLKTLPGTAGVLVGKDGSVHVSRGIDFRSASS